MWESLEGCRLKVIAAAEHMHRFEDAVDGFFESHLKIATINGETNSQRTKYLFRIERVRPHPVREWGIILGDAIHCYRSALDQLAYTFAKEPSNATAFPICVTEKAWVTDAPRRYWSISPALMKLIDRVQPYHGSDPTAHPLTVLGALSNLDKHRGIPTVTLVADAAEAKVISTAGILRWDAITPRTGEPFKKGAVVAECKIVPGNTDTEPYMDVEFSAAFAVAFGEIGAIPKVRNRLVTDVIEEVGLYVARIMKVVGDAWNETVIELGAVDYEALDWPDD